ncbi:MAG: alpha/beta hydrolase [Verrucomicrobia bacterium]|nr:alpha/beta hydrolase [Verrucomicrobiota bacterium]
MLGTVVSFAESQKSPASRPMNALLGGGRQTYPPQMKGARVETYKTVGNTKLNLYIFAPAAASNAPAIVFFFGGAWSIGSPQQFEDQCRHFAERGMVAITADYRVRTRQNATPVQCVEDARSAIRWVRANAAKLGVDPNRIAAGGGSAGGHLAASTAFITEFDAPTEDKTVSATPNALVLFNPGLVLAPLNGNNFGGSGKRATEERFGTKPENISPAHHVKKGAPPTIIFHGKADTTVPYATVEAFTDLMIKAGNRCELVGFDGEQHGFFNSEPFLSQTLKAADKFLTSLGWLKETVAH